MSKATKNVVEETVLATTTSKKEQVAIQSDYKLKFELRLAEQAELDKQKKEARAKKGGAGKVGIIASIFNLLVDLNGVQVTKHEILDVLDYKFGTPPPTMDDEGNEVNAEPSKHTRITMMKTINAQLGNKFPNRMEREKQVVFDVAFDAEGDKLFGLTL